jgi:putative oxidoreductase
MASSVTTTLRRATHQEPLMSDSSVSTLHRAAMPRSVRPFATNLGRVLIAVLFVASGVNKLFAFAPTAGWMSSMGVPLAPLALVATIALEIVVGLMLAAGRAVRASALLLAGFVVLATVLFHAFWAVPADQFADQLVHFLKNVAILGALLVVAEDARS